MSMKHLFFDLDNTLTRSRTRIAESMEEQVRKLIEKGVDIVVISGAVEKQMLNQLGHLGEEVALMAQNGNHASNSVGKLLWKKEMTWLQKREVLNMIDPLFVAFDGDIFGSIDDIVQDRGCQISYSLIGHNAPLDLKEAADPDKAIRQRIMKECHGGIHSLSQHGVQAAIGGTTCIDFFINSKGQNIDQLIKETGWKPDDCLYLGDALFPGGNDHSVVGVIPTRQVKDENECEEVVKEIIRSL